METVMDVEVEELCTRTVARIPIISPAIGFCISSLCPRASPANLPYGETRGGGSNLSLNLGYTLCISMCNSVTHFSV